MRVSLRRELGQGPPRAFDKSVRTWPPVVAVDAGVELLTPSMQHAKEADFRTEVSRITRNFLKCFRTGAKQEVVEQEWPLSKRCAGCQIRTLRSSCSTATAPSRQSQVNSTPQPGFSSSASRANSPLAKNFAPSPSAETCLPETAHQVRHRNTGHSSCPQPVRTEMSED